MSKEEQIYQELLGIREDMGGIKADQRTVFKELNDFRKERREADDERAKGDKQLADDHDILAQRVIDLEQENKFVKRLAKLVIALAAILGTGAVAKVSGLIDKIWKM